LKVKKLKSPFMYFAQFVLCLSGFVSLSAPLKAAEEGASALLTAALRVSNPAAFLPGLNFSQPH